MEDEKFPDRRTKAFRKRKIDWNDQAAVYAYRNLKSKGRSYKSKGVISISDPKAYRKAYADEHRARIAAYQKAYRLENKARQRALNKQWYKDNPKKWNAQNKKYRDKHPEKCVQWAVKSKYGLTLEQLDALGHHCNICGDELQRRKRGETRKQPCIDHDHETGVIRGILCDRCNHGLGHFRDDPKLLMNAIAYLAKNAKGVA